MTRRLRVSLSSRKAQLITTMLVFAIIGTASMLTSRAATPTASLEAEEVAPTGCAERIVDSSASGAGGARAVRFGTGPGCSPDNPGETTFTLASIPDTQVETSSSSGAQRFNNRLQWLANNKASLNLKYAWQVGDLTDWDDETHSHYVRASSGLQILEQAGVPYGLTVGNHDTAAVCYGGSACPDVDIPREFRTITTWHQYFPPSRFAGLTTMCSEFAQFNDRLMASAPSGMATSNHNHPQFIKNRCASQNTTDNGYRTFTAGGLKWLLINYEMWPRSAVQEWMKTVLERHLDHNAILFTHMHLGGSGNIPTDFGGYGSPQGAPSAVQNNVVRAYPNVRFTFSGHTGTAACATFTGVNGNQIYSYLDNRREGSPPPNHVRLMTIDVPGRTATSQLYVPQSGQTLTQSSNCNVSNVTWVQ